LIYWAPTGDTNHDVFTLGFGGASIGMVVSGGESSSSGGEAAGGGSLDLGGGAASGGLPATSTGTAAVPSSPGSTTLQLPSPASRAAKNVPRVLGNRLASAHSPGGIGGWWFLLLALAALAGALLFSRVPALLSTAAAPTCAHERTTPTRRP